MDSLTQKRGERYFFCVDCGNPKTTEKSQRVPLCRSCSDIRRSGVVNNKKICISCGILKPLSDFYPRKNRKNGRSSCKDCEVESTTEWHTEKRNEKRKAFRYWAVLNINAICEFYRLWRAERKRVAKEATRRWQAAHPEIRRQHEKNRRALKKGNGGKISVSEWENLKAFYDFTCLRCGQKEPQITLTQDHVLPLSLGGEHSIDNIQPLCHACNSGKKNRHVDYRRN